MRCNIQAIPANGPLAADRGRWLQRVDTILDESPNPTFSEDAVGNLLRSLDVTNYSRAVATAIRWVRSHPNMGLPVGASARRTAMRVRKYFMDLDYTSVGAPKRAVAIVFES
jgi:hypothetical protein